MWFCLPFTPLLELERLPLHGKRQLSQNGYTQQYRRPHPRMRVHIQVRHAGEGYADVRSYWSPPLPSA